MRDRTPVANAVGAKTEISSHTASAPSAWLPAQAQEPDPATPLAELERRIGKITFGPFAGFIARIISFERDRVVVGIALASGSVQMELDRGMISLMPTDSVPSTPVQAHAQEPEPVIPLAELSGARS